MTAKVNLNQYLPRRDTVVTWIKMIGLSLVLMLLSGCSTLSGFRQTLPNMLINLQKSLGPIWEMVWAFSYLAGIGLVVVGMFKFKRLGEMQGMMSMEHTAREPLVPMFIGIALLFSVSLMDATMQTFFATDTTGALNSYPTTTGMHWSTELMDALLMLARVIGLIVFVRGWLLLTRMGQMHAQPGTLSKGFLHIIGGVMGINISGVIDILQNTLFS